MTDAGVEARGARKPSVTRGAAIALAAVALSYGLLYRDVIRLLIRDWSSDDFSHGFLIVPLALYFVWERREKLKALPVQPAPLAGLAVVLGSLGLLLMGVLGAETFPARLSVVFMVAGCVLFLLGWPFLKALLFPIGFLFLMVPIPKLLFNEIAFPLQLLASKAATGALSLLGIPVLREGNVIILANTTLEVAEACSGLRSLMSLVTLALVYGYFMDPRPLARVFYVVMSVPVAIGANALRVAGTGIAAHWIGPAAAQGFFHTFSGWLVFIAAVVMLFLIQRAVAILAPPARS
jgi:exosortase